MNRTNIHVTSFHQGSAGVRLGLVFNILVKGFIMSTLVWISKPPLRNFLSAILSSESQFR